ncbi:efflux RND transporter periplasmic adaptor subunit [Flavobacteriaceae bacterium PRS1]|nr:efflux RND transporter periplasmic adaptor subunit [Flavobacteriaceae bacterium PRS1]
MKHIYTILVLTILIFSCGSDKKKSVEDVIATNNLEAIRAKKDQIISKQIEIVEQLKQLDAKIDELDTTKKVALISTFTVKEEVFNHYLELQGNVSTKNLLVIYPEYAGILSKVYVREGQYVKKGQILAKIDDGGLSQQLAQLQIRSDLAKTTFERQDRLWKQNIGSEMQYLQAKSNFEVQQQMVNQIQIQLDKTIVKAPFSGTIDDIISEQGSVVAPGQSQLMRIVNLDNMYIETNVPESNILTVVKNKTVIVEFPVLGKTIHAKIRQASNYINPANRTFKVEIAVPNKDKSIKLNLTVKLKINDYTNKKALLIPQSIVSENSKGEQYIYVIIDKQEDNIAVVKKAIIQTGKTQGDVIEVLSGIENGTEVINEGARRVEEGQTVQVENN